MKSLPKSTMINGSRRQYSEGEGSGEKTGICSILKTSMREEVGDEEA